MGVLLFGDHLRLFGTFLQAFSLNVMYLRSSNAENLIVDSSRQQMLITVYVIAFCVCMVVFSSLVSSFSLCKPILFYSDFYDSKYVEIQALQVEGVAIPCMPRPKYSTLDCVQIF